jgi:hypothetical protein
MFIAHRIPPLLGDEAPDDSRAAKLNGYIIALTMTESHRGG